MSERVFLQKYFQNAAKIKIWQAYDRCDKTKHRFKKFLPTSLKKAFAKLENQIYDEDFLSRKKFIAKVASPLIRIRFSWVSARDRNRGKRLHALWERRFQRCRRLGDLFRLLTNEPCRRVLKDGLPPPLRNAKEFLKLDVLCEINCRGRIPDLLAVIRPQNYYLLIEIKSTKNLPVSKTLMNAYKTQVLDSVKCLRTMTKRSLKIASFLFFVTAGPSHPDKKTQLVRVSSPRFPLKPKTP